MKQWTRPYLGVQHLSTPKSHQITLTNRGEFAEVYLLSLRSDHPFTSIKEFTGNLEDCKTHGEKWADNL